ncbi:hypothetical protein O3P69_008443 [Scylla paramamosain]|uniref:Uncharacterized protein n=1 Tax=Scylla paramamosain TaxID=85552 RepID=A0AAW0SL87_SCYPA
MGRMRSERERKGSENHEDEETGEVGKRSGGLSGSATAVEKREGVEWARGRARRRCREEPAVSGLTGSCRRNVISSACLSPRRTPVTPGARKRKSDVSRCVESPLPSNWPSLP